MKLLVTSTLLASLLIGASLWYSPETQAAFDGASATPVATNVIDDKAASGGTVFAGVQSPSIMALSLLAIGGLLGLAGYNSRKPKRGRRARLNYAHPSQH